jgi:hypothetical protein
MVHATRATLPIQSHRDHIEAHCAREESALRQPPSRCRPKAPGLSRTDRLERLPVLVARPSLDLHYHHFGQTTADKVQFAERSALVSSKYRVTPVAQE